MIDGTHYQTAYVTPDLDKALATFTAAAETRNVIEYEGSSDVLTASGPATTVNKLGLAWVNDLQYEFIQPISDPEGVFSEALATGKTTFHHLAYRVADWDIFREKVAAHPYPIVIERNTGDLKFLYLDARTVLGHYLEYVWMTDEMWERTGGQ
ncbi:VOC family protein [Microbacterium saperdae]